MKNIAILTGGDSAEYDISLLSAETVYNNLDRTKYNPYLIEIKNNNWKIKIDNEFYSINKNLKISIENQEIEFKNVFMAIHGPPAENGELQIYFEKNNIKFTCCSSEVSKLTFNKFLCNKTLKKLNYNIANSIILEKNNYNLENITKKFKFPFIVKPNQAGSSHGISLVKEKTQIENSLNVAFSHDNEVIIEEFIKGTEVSCGVFKINDDIIVLPITEIVSENEIFDYDAKYNNKSQEITPARISDLEKNLVQNNTKKIYKELDLRGLCRIDYIISDGQPFVIEINTIPGLSEKSIMPQQLQKAGYNLKEVFTICLEN
tara:strand:+ start:521 stop:1474 length:954 start_codon:yes stop_codon:yes gene_type:complete